MNFVNIVSLATRRGVRTKAVVITMALVCTLFSGFALAGQGPSQWCDDGVGNAFPIVHDPITLDLELGPAPGNNDYYVACYSTTPYGSGADEATGGSLIVKNPATGTAGADCHSDPAAKVRLNCEQSTNLNTSNPTSPSASTFAGAQVTVLGTPVPIPGTGAGVQTGCTHGYTAGTGGIGCGSGGSPGRPSQWCDDGAGNAFPMVHDPITLDAELDSSSSWACYSTVPYDSSATEATGGAIGIWHPSATGAGAYCASDPSALVRLDNCSTGVGLNISNPTAPGVNASSSNGVNVLGTPINAPPVGMGVQTGCSYGYTVGTGGVGCGSGGPAARYSQWCADGGGNEGPRLIHDPVTLDLELGSSPGNPNYILTCYSSSPYTSSSETTGGALILDTPLLSGAGARCYSDGNASVRLDCYNAVGYNASNPTAPSVNTSSSNGVNVLGTPINVPSAGAGTDCNSGTVAVSISSCANGGLLGVSGLGYAGGSGYWINGTYINGVAASGTGDSSAGALAASGTGWAGGNFVGVGGTGCSTSWYLSVNGGCSYANSNDINGVHVQGIALSGTGPASGEALAASGTGCTGGNNPQTGISISATNCAWAGLAGISGLGDSGGLIAASGTGWGGGWYLGASGMGPSTAAVLAISGTGTASSVGDGLIPGVAISGTDAATGRDIAISGSDDAAGTVAVSGTENANGGLASVSGTGCAQGGVAASAIECNPGEGGDPENELVNRSDYTAANCQENTEGNLNSFISTPDPGRLTEPPVYCSGDAAMRAGGYPGAVKAYSQNEIRNQSQVTTGEAETVADSAAEQAVVLVDTIAGIAMAQYERLSDLEYSLTAEATSLSPGDPLSNLTLCPSGCYVLATNGGSDGGDSLQDFNRHKGVTRMGWDPRKSNGHLDGIYIFNFYFAAYDPRNEWDFYASSMKSSVTPSKARIEEVRTEVKPAKEGLALIDAEPFVVRKYGSAGSMTASASLAGQVKGISAGFSISRTWNFAEGKAGGGMLSNQTVYSLWQGKETTAQGTVGTEVWRIPTSSPVKWTPSAYAIYSCYRWDC